MDDDIDDPHVLVKSKRITGLTFHRTFSLERRQITELLQLADEQKGIELSRKTIREKTIIGTIAVEAVPRYAFGAGLLDDKKRLTVFGRFAHLKDNVLVQPSTQWLMHYHLSAPHGPGAAFWHDLVTTRFRSGDQFTQDEIANQISNFIYKTKNVHPRIEDADITARVFLGSYIKQEGLSNLGILSELSSKNFQVLDPNPPETWAVACALMDLWQAQYPAQATINLNTLYGEDGLTNIFMIGKGRLNAMLEEMQQAGMLELYRIAPPYQVALLWQDIKQPLEKLYGTEITD